MKSKYVFPLLFGQAEISGNLANFGLFLLRLYAGITIMSAGLDKLPVPQWMIDQVITIGFPFPEFFAWVACFSEFAFGLLLIIGLNTRVSALFLAITLGTAAFGFQKVTPFLQMHIAQHFFWIFVMYVFIGAGKFSLDYIIMKHASKSISKSGYISPLLFVILLIYVLSKGLFLESKQADSDVKINTINIAGSFNDWDPSSIDMKTNSDGSYTADLEFSKSGLIVFKFTANNSWDMNWGEEDQESAGFPISGKSELDKSGNTQNLRVYIPSAGTYKFYFNLSSFEYSLDSLHTDL
jgi:putative oxidoreductase